MSIRINVRVFPASQRQTKTGKTMFTQSCQVDQADRPAHSFTRRYFDEAKVLPAGEYTAAFTLYSVQSTNKAGFVDTHSALAFRDFQLVPSFSK